MPRRRFIAKREIIKDPKYHSERVSRFINVVMMDGKKSIAEKIVYGALKLAAEKLASKIVDDGDEGGSGSGKKSASSARKEILVFEGALQNVSPSVEVRSRRVGGATYQIPVEVRPSRSQALGMRWIVQASRTRTEKGMTTRLASEIMDAYEQKGSSVKKREDTHRMAKANQAFAHFRWN